MDCSKDNLDKMMLTLGAFVVVKFLGDMLCGLCTRRKNKYDTLLSEIAELKAQNERIIAGLYAEPSEASSTEDQAQAHAEHQTQEETQDQTQTQDSVPPETQDQVQPETNTITDYSAQNIVDELSHSAKVEEKHRRLVRCLTPGQQVFVSYKKTTFPASFRLLPSAPHGYVFEAGTESFLTPSQFSFKRKHALNPEVSSDNGWDTVYVITGKNEKNKDIKKSLNDLIAVLPAVSEAA